MAASLITRTGNSSALEKLKPIQPLPKCFGFLAIRPLRTGTGKPIDALSNFQPRTVWSRDSSEGGASRFALAYR